MTSFSGAPAVFCARRPPGCRVEAPDDRRRMGPASPLEEERREVFESVLQAMATTESDPDRTAACRYSLRHLALGAPRDPLSGGGTARG
jgi:hypothetical protein